jgi:predicted ATPase
MQEVDVGMDNCDRTESHEQRRIVLTGGPGAGKTAVLELMRKSLCKHVRIVPESAGIVFGGGFPRDRSREGGRAAQRAIFYVQRELEAVVSAEDVAIALCDRGTIDALAYWPGPDAFWPGVGTTLDEQLARYHAVIHLRTPSALDGYNHQNPLRIESAAEANAIDARIAEAWAKHPRRYEVPSAPDFLVKAKRVIDIVRGELPPCCRHHPVLELGERAGELPAADGARSPAVPRTASTLA